MKKVTEQRIALSGRCDNGAHNDCRYPERCKCDCHVAAIHRTPAERCAFTCHDPSYRAMCETPHRCLLPEGHEPKHDPWDFEGHDSKEDWIRKTAAQDAPPELKPCPFAHHFDQLRLAQSHPEPYVSDEADGEFAVVCRVCGGSTRRYYRRDMAVRAWNTRATDAEIERLREALRGLFKLIEDGDLVRDISKDDDFVYFTHQGIRITNAIGAARAALQKGGE